MNIIEWAEGGVRRDTEPVSAWATALARSVRDADFVCADTVVAVPEVMYTSSSGLQRWRGAPMTEGLSTRFAMRSVLSVRLHASGLSGRLFVLDKPQLTGDELVLGALVAHEVETSLEHHGMVQRLRDAAASEARVRVARDVHDDVMQSMTAISLGLETVGRLIEQDPARAREQLAELQGRLGSDQRSLRTAVRGLKRRAAPPAQLAAQLAEMVGDVEQEWGLPVKLDSDLRGVTVADSAGHEIRQIVREAVVNAARHARASAVSVSVRHVQGELHVTVMDDGRGFPFHGKYSDADRRRLRVGPGVLAERVEALGGSLAIDSSNTGARLDMRIPLS
jgi:signal transduction histidine kinase